MTPIAKQLFLVPFLLSIFISPTVWGFKPEDAEVKKMVDRGLAYLQSSGGLKDVPGVAGTIESSEILLGYSAHKAGQDHSNPLITRAISQSLKLTRSNLSSTRQPAASVSEGGESGGRGSGGGVYEAHNRTYELAMAILLFTDMDPVAYLKDVQAAVDFLTRIQLPEGSWGYPHQPYGDTSQTQYVMLGLWSADRSGAVVQPAAMERGLNWLLKTQTGGGGFMYRPTLDRSKDTSDISFTVRKSLVLGGLGTALIAGDFFKFYVGTGESAEDIGLPKALRRVVPKSKGRSTGIKSSSIGSLTEKGDGWMSKNAAARKADDWHYYSIYAAERYYSFKELSEGLQVPEPEWYNDGVRELQRNQSSNGAWGEGDPSREGPQVSTALAILFLVRSTKKSIGVLNSGVLAGGYGLPKNVSNAKIKDGAVKGDSAANSINDLMALLEDEGADDIDPNTIPDALPLAKDPVARKEQLSRLQRLARGQVNGSWMARRVAVRTLVQSDDLAIAPTLIFALTDGDGKVKTMARDGLRMISRRFDDGFGFSDEVKADDVTLIQQRWKDWYLALNPGYQFLD